MLSVKKFLRGETAEEENHITENSMPKLFSWFGKAVSAAKEEGIDLANVSQDDFEAMDNASGSGETVKTEKIAETDSALSALEARLNSLESDNKRLEAQLKEANERNVQSTQDSYEEKVQILMQTASKEGKIPPADFDLFKGILNGKPEQEIAAFLSKLPVNPAFQPMEQVAADKDAIEAKLSEFQFENF